MNKTKKYEDKNVQNTSENNKNMTNKGIISKENNKQKQIKDSCNWDNWHGEFAL